MPRLHFTTGSLRRTRILPETDRIRETLFALELLASGGGGPELAHWRRTVGRQRPAKRLIELAKAIRPFPDIDRLVQRAHWRDRPSATPTGARPNRVTQTLQHFYHASVAPYWDQIAKSLEYDRVARMSVLRERGADGLLSSLHPKVQWSCSALEVPGHGTDLKLESVGLTIAPSFFLPPGATVLIRQTPLRPGPTLFYPIRSDDGPVHPRSADTSAYSTMGMIGAAGE
ncbi:hypothetical protein [Streptomyces sp. NPDC048637]|uniref:hypothetical protein n=1 Tax=Streptomyces sp. NPDC048637 TaxID=3155636 RepID=UPI003449400E